MEGTASPRTTPEKETKPIALPEVTTIAASTSGGPLALAALALFALAVASCSLLYLLIPATGSRARG